MKKYLYQTVIILLISVGASLFTYNLLHFKSDYYLHTNKIRKPYETYYSNNEKPTAVSISTYYFYSNDRTKYITAGIFLFTLGVSLRSYSNRKSEKPL